MDKILSHTPRFKRNCSVNILLSAEDVEMLDALINSTPFQPSRSEIGCVLHRRIMHRIRQGLESLEDLYKKYLNNPLPANEPDLIKQIEVNYASEIVACMKANECDFEQAVTIIFGLGARHGSFNGYRPAEEKEEAERLRA